MVVGCVQGDNGGREGRGRKGPISKQEIPLWTTTGCGWGVGFVRMHGERRERMDECKAEKKGEEVVWRAYEEALGRNRG